MNLVVIDESRCRLSYSCVRVCPVSAIEVSAEKEYPFIVPDRCVGCGSCIQACGQHAITYRSSVAAVKELLHSGTDVAIILSPEIAAEFGDVTDYRKFVTMIKELGFKWVIEGSFGVDLDAIHYASLLKHFRGKYYLTSACPVIVSMIRKYHPDLVDNLAPIITPMAAVAAVVHEKYGTGTKIVYLGPCIESKTEAADSSGVFRVDEVLTFEEIREMFRVDHISETPLEYSDFDAPLGNLGAYYPLTEGLLLAAGLDANPVTGLVFTAVGKDNVKTAIRAFEENPESLHRHLNLFYCEGCSCGPGMTKGVNPLVRKSWVIDYAGKRIKMLDKSGWKADIRDFSGLDCSRAFSPDDRRLLPPPESRIREVLKALGKTDTEAESSCGICGYENCRAFAAAVAQGIAKTEMCHVFSMRNRQDYIKSLRQTNEKLARTQEALKESEKMARHEQQLAQDAMETINAMLQKLPSGLVIVDEKLRIIQSNGTFINMLGREAEEINEVVNGLKGADLKTLLPYSFYNLFSYVIEKDDEIVNKDVRLGEKILNASIFTIRKNKIVGSVIRDMHMPEVANEEVIRRVGEAISENLEVVQKIAFLLGEGASKTEQILNSIIEFHKPPKQGKQ